MTEMQQRWNNFLSQSPEALRTDPLLGKLRELWKDSRQGSDSEGRAKTQ
jgi:hypothetical protein